jgi:uncharacterized integral membrane protein
MSTLETISPREYADQFMQKLRALGDGRDWIFEEAEQRLRAAAAASAIGNGSPQVVSLGNLYREWMRKPPRARAEHMQTAVLGILQGYIPEAFEEVRAKLMPIVRSAAERGEAMILSKGGTTELLFRPICDDLEAGLAFDSPHSVIRLSTSHFARWGVSEDEAFAIALENLRARSSKPMKEIGPDTYVSVWNDDFDAARMLLTDYMLDYVSMGAPVVMVPARNKLLLTSDRNDMGLEQLLRHAEEGVGSPKAMSPLMLRLINGQWSRFEPPGFAVRLNNLRKTFRGEQYDKQKRLLDERLRMEGRSILVAAYLIGKGDEDTPVMSACSWTKGIKSLLPAVDMICFSDPEAEAADGFAVHWKPVATIAGKLMRQTNDRPPRFYVSAYPDAQQLALLREAAINPDAAPAKAKPKAKTGAKAKPAVKAHDGPKPAKTKSASNFEWGAVLGVLICWPLLWLAAINVGTVENIYLSIPYYLGMLGLALAGLVYLARIVIVLWPRRD